MTTKEYHYFDDLPYSGNRSKFAYGLVCMSAFALIALGLWGLFFQRHYSSLQDKTKPIANIRKLISSPERKYQGGLGWGPLSVGDLVYEGDLIYTDSSSFTEVDAKNGDFNISIEPNSLVRVSEKDMNYELELIKGSASLNIRKGLGKRIKVKSENNSLEIDGEQSGEIRLSRDDKTVKAQTESGQVEVSSKLGNVEVQQHRNVLISPKDSQTFAPDVRGEYLLKLSSDLVGDEKYTIKIRNPKSQYMKTLDSRSFNAEGERALPLPDPGRYVINVASDKQQSIQEKVFFVSDYQRPNYKIEPSNQEKLRPGEDLEILVSSRQARHYEIQTKTPGGEVNTKRFRGHKYTFSPSEEGIYEMRLRVYAKDAPWGARQQKNVRFEQTLETLEMERDRFVLNDKGRVSVPLGVKADKKGKFVFEISGAQDFDSVKKRIKSEKNVINLTVKNTGEYFWRAKSLGEGGIQEQSPLRSFEVYRRLPLMDTENLTIYTDKKEDISISQKFKGQPFENIDANLVITSKERKNPIRYDVESQEKFFVPGIGEYQVRLEPSKNDKFILPSRPIRLQVLPKVRSLTPKINQRQYLYLRDTNKGKGHVIKLPNTKEDYRYELQIFSSKTDKNPLVSTIVGHPHFAVLRETKSGKLYYRARLVDEWGRKGDYSQMGELVYPISPLLND